MESNFTWYDYEAYTFKLQDVKIATSALLILIMIVALFGNILVCIAFCRYRRLRIITNYFVLSLAVSDILVASVSMPLFLSFELTEWRNLPDWIDGMKLYQFLETIDIICCVSSIINLTAISIDRFFGIVMPLKHKAFMTESIAVSCIVAVWMYSCTIAVAKLIPGFKHYIIFNFLAGFALPLIVISGAYVFIFITVKKHSKKKLSNVLAQEWMLARTILIVISLFVVCWAPFYIVQLLYQYCIKCTFADSVGFEHVLTGMKLLHYFNSCCNPFVYGYFNVSFKQAFKSIFTKFLKTKEERDINSNGPELSLATTYSFAARNRSFSGFNSILSDAELPLKKYSTENEVMLWKEQPQGDNQKTVEGLVDTRKDIFDYNAELKLMNKALDLVRNITFGTLKITDTDQNLVSGQQNDVEGMFSSASVEDIDWLLAESKESNL